nr:zinc finger, CCHC-type [Tanacetum cinerariifolium]
MKERETISGFASKLSSIRANFRNLGNTLESKIIVRKLLNSVPKKFLPIVATIEQYQDLDEMSFEEAVVRLTACEERIKSQDTLEANVQHKLLLASFNNQSHGKGRGKNFNKEAKENMKWKNSPNARGTIHVGVIASFRKMKKMTTHKSLVVAALKESFILVNSIASMNLLLSLLHAATLNNEQDWRHGMRIKLLKCRRKNGHDTEKRSSVQADSLGDKESKQSNEHHDDTPHEESDMSLDIVQGSKTTWGIDVSYNTNDHHGRSLDDDSLTCLLVKLYRHTHVSKKKAYTLQHLPFSPATIPGNPGRLVAGDNFPGRHVAREKLNGKDRMGYLPGRQHRAHIC